MSSTEWLILSSPIAGRRVCLFTDRAGVRPLLERAESTPGIERVLHRPANLEDVFLRLAGKELRQ